MVWHKELPDSPIMVESTLSANMYTKLTPHPNDLAWSRGYERPLNLYLTQPVIKDEVPRTTSPVEDCLSLSVTILSPDYLT